MGAVMREPGNQPAYIGRWRPDAEVEGPPPVGQMPIVMAALSIGILLMGIQLWLLTVALDLYLAGRGLEVWRLALISGLIFLGGLGMLWILHRRPHVHGTTAG
jgi:hypothetical protein